MTGRRLLLAAACATVGATTAACSPRSRSSSPDVSTNSCALNPCVAYDAGSPTCFDNVCVAGRAPPPASLVLLVSVPSVDPISAALQGLTVIVPYASLRAPAPSAPAGTPPIGELSAVSVAAAYLVRNSDAQNLGFNLGNNGTTLNSVPVHVTYRPLFAPGSLSGSPGAGGPQGTLVDAADAGLPVLPLRYDYAIPVPQDETIALGPNGATPTLVSGPVQSGLGYEQTIAPDPPFDRAYPPVVQTVSFSPFFVGNTTMPIPLDSSTRAPGRNGIPFATFDVSGTDRPLDGWTAYLRDATTGRVLSPVRTLSGMTTCGLTLPTSHLPSAVSEGLSNAQLVIAPPASEPAVPTEVFTYPDLVFHTIYNALPAPVTVSGAVTLEGPPPAAGADVYFEVQTVFAAAVDVPNPCGTSFTDPTAPDDAGVDAGPLTYVALPATYEFVARAPLDFGAGNGFAPYTIALPQGVYRVIVRPRDVLGASSAGAAAIAVVDGFDTSGGAVLTSAVDAGPVSGPPLTLAPAVAIEGTARIGDGRPLAGAVVEALPQSCAAPSVADGATPPPDTARCLPRYAEVPVNDDGTFQLFLDRGTYLVRVEPAESSALPWVSQVVLVTSATHDLRFVVPAPVRRPLQLVDEQQQRPIAEALVRMFALPDAGPAVEVGRTYTDSTGTGTIYVDPAVR